MNYSIITIISVIFILIIILYRYIKNRDSDLYKKYTLKDISANDIDRDILIKFAKYEKFIYIHGFTRRVLIEYRYKKHILYRAYYYNLLNGVHLYLEDDPSKGEEGFNFIFATQFKNNEFITYNNSFIDPLDELTTADSREQYKDATIEYLYQKHLENRKRVDDEIVYNRLTLKELLYNRYNINSKKTPTTKALNRSSVKRKRSSSLGLKILLAIITIFGIGFLYYKIYSPFINKSKITTNKKTYVEKKIEPIKDMDKEFKEFKKKVKDYKALTLTLSNQKKYSIEKSLSTIEHYLKESKIDRKIGKPTVVKIDKGILPCAIPKELEELYNWHDGVEKFIPARDFYSIEDLVKNYIKYNKKSRSSYVIVFGEKDGTRGLAYNCNKDGLYEYDSISKEAAKKDFYNIAHFLDVVANSYKVDAFYDEKAYINIDMKNFLNIYRKHLTKIDKNRYEYLVSYLKRKAIQYKKYGNKKLKLTLLQKIENLYDSRLTSSAGIFLKSKDNKIKAKAIEVIGKIGDKDSLNILKPLLKSNNSRVKDFTLLAIANLVDKNSTNILKEVYPLLKDRSIFVRLSAYRVIERVASNSSLQILRDNFTKENSSVKIGILRAFAKIGDSGDIKLLSEYLDKLPDTIDKVDPKEYIRGSKPGNLILSVETQNAIDGIKNRIRKNFRISSKN